MKSEKQHCPTCGQNISEREISLYRGMVDALWRVYKWAKIKGVHEFTRQDIKHLLANENDTARFGDWVILGGGLVYKYRKARYGLNLPRCEEFWAGRYQIPARVWKNPVTRELRKEDYRFIHEIPTILELLNNDQEYVVRYREPQGTLS